MEETQIEKTPTAKLIINLMCGFSIVIWLIIGYVLVDALKAPGNNTYHTAVSWIVSVFFVSYAYRHYKRSRIGMALLYFIAAIIYNPLSKPYFGAKALKMLDWTLVAIVLLHILVTVRELYKNNQAAVT